MVVCLPVTKEGQIGDGWGRAHDVAVARVDNASGNVEEWDEYPVRWDEWHGQGGEGQHHARMARFLMEHAVEQVICAHMGDGMLRMLQRMNVGVVVDVHGDAREAASRYGRLGGLPH
jgi:predicted Fe-Mo cluster-binding NifX family protein